MPSPRSAPSPLKLAFSGSPASVPPLRRLLKRAIPGLPKNHLTEVSIALVSDRKMSQLHALSHNDPSPTDVLTYELEHNARGNVTEGQIVICVPEARRRAGESKIPLQNELLLYALHGLLHLCGMNDLTDQDFRRIHLTEDRILTAIGIGPVFHGPTTKQRTPARSPRQPAKRSVRHLKKEPVSR